MLMVLEKTISPYDVEKAVIDAFGENSLSLVITDNAIVLTRLPANKCPSALAMASENTLAKDWLQPEEEDAWKFL
jgi:hypothetical protein